MTAFNESDLKGLHITPFANAIGRVADPLEWGKGIADVINRANYQRNVNALSEALLTPADQTAAALNRARQAAPASRSMLPALLLDANAGSPNR